MKNSDTRLIAFFLLAGLTAPSSLWAAPAKKTASKAKPKAAAPSKPASAAPTAAPASGQAPMGSTSAPSTPVKSETKSEGELENVDVTGTFKGKLKVGKFDPPAAFNLEDIQNFPEDRLQPVLSNAVTFDESRDFAGMMEKIDDQLYHPWLPEIARAPFLQMQPAIDQTPRDWTFAVIDQSGGTVYEQEGKGSPSKLLVWQGEDKLRDRAAVDTVYIPQVLITNKEGYRRTYQGQPVQFASVMYTDRGKTIIEISTKRLFDENKSSLSKEAPIHLDKLCDAIREGNLLPFAVQMREPKDDLVKPRQEAVVKYVAEKLLIPESQITALPATSAEKRGAVVSITANATPGGSGQ